MRPFSIRPARRRFVVFPLLIVLFPLISVLLANILGFLTPKSGEAASINFATYHDTYYGYSIPYPKTWKVTNTATHSVTFVAPGTATPCQVSVNVTRKVMTAQKALTAIVPQGAYSISHPTVAGLPAVSFWQYTSGVQTATGTTSASTRNVVIAQANKANGVNEYTLSLNLFRAAFAQQSGKTAATGCENNFTAMTSSLQIPSGGTNGLTKAVPGVLTDPNNPAIVYAENYWDNNYYDPSNTTDDLYCDKSGYNGGPPYSCKGSGKNAMLAPGVGYYQPYFECAEFVARALAAEGYINFDPYTYPSYGSNSLNSFQGYDLLSASNLYDFLTQKLGGVDIGDNPAGAIPGDVVFYSDTSGIQHTTILSQTGTTKDGSDTVVYSHNEDYQNAPYDQFYNENNVLYKPTIVHLPSLNSTPPGVTLYGSYYYNSNASSTATTYTNPGFFQVTSPISSISVQPGWSLIAYQNANGGGLQKTFYSNAPDLRNVAFDNSSQIVDKQIAAIRVYSSPVCTSSSASAKKLSARLNASCNPPPCTDGATFITDVNFPDGAAVVGGQSFTKTWQIQNSGNCTWSGYTLNFVNGVQLSGPPSVSVPTTSPGQTVNISVPLTAPVAGGTYRGYWQLEDNQGVDVSQGGGGTMWVEISVPYGSNNGTGSDSISASYPSVVTPGQHFQPQVTVTIASGQLLQSRGDMLRNVDGNLYSAWPFVAVVGTVNPGTPYTFTFYANNPIVAPGSEGTYSSVWQLWQNGQWYGPSITITFTVKNGGGTAPPAPTLNSPSNWDFQRDGSTPQLCASSSDGNVQYDFQIYQSAQTPDSGWINGNCWTPNPSLGPYTFAWHVRVMDNASGLVSGWSDTWNFSIASQQLSMDPITFYPPSPSASEGVQVRSCVHGFGDVNLGLSYEINTATDGSDSGVWHGFSNAGNNCPDPNNPSTWGSFPSLQYADGDHLVRATGFGPQGQTMVMQATYHLNHRRPQQPLLVSPISNVRVNTDTVNFVWQPATNAFSYQLIISANADLSSPLFSQNIGNVTSYQYTFSQDVSPAYWQVIAFNDVGQNSSDITPFGIDRVPPTASVTALPATTTDTTFTVTWSGSDADAGIEWYNLQYRDGNDPNATWVNWQTNTTAIAALFTGEPGHTYYFRAQAMDNATNLSNYAAGNGDTYTLIDLNARPATPWWNSSYGGKRNLIILNNDTNGLPSGYPIHLHFDASTTPTASDIYGSSQSANPGDDIRIVYQDTTEMPRYIANFTSSQIDIWFNLQASIGSNPTTDSTDYQLYYGDPNATTPTWGINDIIPEPTDSNTLGLWHLQEGSGSSISDSSGNGHNGTASNMGWTSGKFGPAGTFNGTNSVVNLGNSTAFDTSTITLEAWVYPTNVGSEQSILRKTADDGSLIYDFLVQGDGVYLRLNGNSGYVRSNTKLQNNRWYHIAATYDGSTIRVYINGNLDNSVSYNVPLRYGTSTNLYLGGDGQSNNKFFYGYIQDARISNTVRTSFPYGVFANTLSEPSTNAGSPVTPPAQGTPSLDVQSVNVVPGANGTNTFVVVIQNQGNVTTGNGFSTDLYLNHQPTGPGDYSGSVNSWVASPIDSNQAITLTTTVTAPANSRSISKNGMPTETTQTYYVQADSTGALSKYDQSGQTITGPITVCTASPDAYEGDNTSATAKPISLNSTQIHNFDTPGDQDWVSFKAQKGITYTLTTSNLGPNANTVLNLYAADGVTLLASNDDYNGTPASQIIWRAPASGTYYAQVTDWSPYAGGCGTTYSLSVKKGAFLTVSPTSGTYQQTIFTGGTSFTAGEPVNLYLDSTNTTALMTVTADSSGSFNTSFNLPAASLGSHTLFAVGQKSLKVAIRG